MNFKPEFENFLKEWHMKDYIGTDDDSPDAFDEWISNIGVDSLIKLADVYAYESFIRGIKHGGEVAVNAMKI